MFPELRFGIPMLWMLLLAVLGDEDIRRNFAEGGNVVIVFIEVFCAALWVRNLPSRSSSDHGTGQN